MLLTLDLKRSIKLCHCSSVASVEEVGCGLGDGLWFNLFREVNKEQLGMLILWLPQDHQGGGYIAEPVSRLAARLR